MMLPSRKRESMVMNNREYRGYLDVNEQGAKSNKDFEYWVNLCLGLQSARENQPQAKKMIFDERAGQGGRCRSRSEAGDARTRPPQPDQACHDSGAHRSMYRPTRFSTTPGPLQAVLAVLF
jgi:hypothetical protein